MPAHAAQPKPPGPGEVVPGQRTETPALVEGIREAAKPDASAADAARGHLADKKSRYRIADPQRDLKPVGTTTAGRTEIVRLQQKYRGIDVLGGQYVVRMENSGSKRVVTGTSGKYFTGLKAATEPQVETDLAIERAVDAVTAGLPAPGGGGQEPELTGTDQGLVVLPKGEGVLTRHITVRGTAPATGEPVLQEVYVDAASGYPVLRYSSLKTFEGPQPFPAAGPAARAAHRSEAAADGIQGSGAKLDGTTVPLQITRDDARKLYVLRDRTRSQDTSEKNRIATWDARAKSVGDVSGTWPWDIKEFASPAPAFGKDATEAGAVDAHWAAGKVYDYYKQQHGRTSLDGRGMALNSLVGVSWYGMPYVNAFWDGTKMVYGNGDKEYRPLSAGLDVVGHEMTHGVVQNTADLVYAGQSGAMNEALADYFGNAIKTDTYGIAMDSPDSGLLGDTLCRTRTPRQCAIRDMNDGRTTSTSFLGVAIGTDNGGVHLNSTIFSGALWDIRKDLGGPLADKLVYTALSAYLTPLDGFTEGRAAVLAAARDLKLTDGQLRAVERSFNAHGIVPGWELAMGVDSDVLLAAVNTDGSRVGAGGGWWAASASNETGTEPYSVWAGRTDGSGQRKLISPNNGAYNVHPATDGKTVVWQSYQRRVVRVLARPIAGGPVKELYVARRGVGNVRVEGDIVTLDVGYPARHRHVMYTRLSDPTHRWTPVDAGGTTSLDGSIGHGRIAYTTYDFRKKSSDVEILDLSTGNRTRVQQPASAAGFGPTAISGNSVYWLAPGATWKDPTVVRRANLDGTGVKDLTPAQGPDALRAVGLTASDDALTVSAVSVQPADSRPRNESLAKLWQFTADGSPRGRVSCNRGEQSAAAAAGGRQVVWVDATTGSTDLVTRNRPAGNCG
ncbi:M4 family metallopeptidase [Streptomyces gamaensis]|uniref:M4 family metallopeptidase n=1 Tax=Streptomyces gamaensis TaxID=1763542 RepID=A0ABW0YUC9_9ACTN